MSTILSKLRKYKYYALYSTRHYELPISIDYLKNVYFPSLKTGATKDVEKEARRLIKFYETYQKRGKRKTENQKEGKTMSEMDNEIFLLTDGSKESEEAAKMLKENGINFKPILVDNDTGRAMPSLLTPDNEYLGVNGVRYYIETRKK